MKKHVETITFHSATYIIPMLLVLIFGYVIYQGAKTDVLAMIEEHESATTPAITLAAITPVVTPTGVAVNVVPPEPITSLCFKNSFF